MIKKIFSPLVLLIGISSSLAVAASLPVVDLFNYYQNIQMLAKQAQQYQQQFLQYKNQLDHYKNLVKNTKQLTSFQWDDASQIINNLVDKTNTIDYYKREAGSLKSYLDRYQTSDHYLKGACFTGNCSKQEMEKIKKNRLQASVAQKRANDAMLKGIDKQQLNLKNDADKLRTLQLQAQNSDGQMKAIQAASQLASNQAHQLLQIRGLLVAQQNAQATRDAAVLNTKAIKEAGDERFRQGSYHKSSGKKW